MFVHRYQGKKIKYFELILQLKTNGKLFWSNFWLP